MSWQITFTERYHYQTTSGGIDVPTTISNGGRIATFMAKVDTGAQYCLFKREHGEQLGLNLEAGVPITLDSLGGQLEAFGHEVTIQTFDMTFRSLVYFAEHPALRRNILGRVGWLRNIKIGVIDYDEMIYIATYDSES
jgi:hypothetical protein